MIPLLYAGRGYSPEARARHARHIREALRFGVFWFGLHGAILAAGFYLFLRSEVFVYAVAVTIGIIFVSALSAIFRLLDLARPHLMTYFSGEVPGSGLCGGRRLLRHSKALDELAASAGLRTIGSFVSDDDLFDGAGPTWHSAAEALATFSGLIEKFPAHPAVVDARRDLEEIRDRLRIASERGLGFCLLVRDVHVTNAMEWGLRKGTC